MPGKPALLNIVILYGSAGLTWTGEVRSAISDLVVVAINAVTWLMQLGPGHTNDISD